MTFIRKLLSTQWTSGDGGQWCLRGEAENVRPSVTQFISWRPFPGPNVQRGHTSLHTLPVWMVSEETLDVLIFAPLYVGCVNFPLASSSNFSLYLFFCNFKMTCWSMCCLFVCLAFILVRVLWGHPASVVWCLTLTWGNIYSLLFQLFFCFYFIFLFLLLLVSPLYICYTFCRCLIIIEYTVVFLIVFVLFAFSFLRILFSWSLSQILFTQMYPVLIRCHQRHSFFSFAAFFISSISFCFSSGFQLLAYNVHLSLHGVYFTH